MNRLFGTKKEAPKPEPVAKVEPKKEEPKVVVPLGDHSKRLDVKIQEMNATVSGMDKELADLYAKMKTARGSHQTFYKNRCIMLMKKRKMYQQQIDTLLSQQFSIDQIAFTQDNIQNTIETTNALRDATTAQKEAMKNINLDQLEDLRDEMDDMMYETNEINDLLNRDYTVDVDESELDDQLRDLDNEFFMEMMKNQNQPQQQKASNGPDLSMLASKAQNIQ